jgi:hypothetical protein
MEHILSPQSARLLIIPFFPIDREMDVSSKNEYLTKNNEFHHTSKIPVMRTRLLACDGTSIDKHGQSNLCSNIGKGKQLTAPKHIHI